MFELLSSILGFGAGIGGQIPGLRKSKQASALKAAQRGQGAGAVLARQSGNDAARNALSVAQGGHGATRGLALRTGLRSAEDIRSRAAGQAAAIAAQEAANATSQLTRLEQGRRDNARVFGATLGSGLSSLAAQKASQDTSQPTQEQQAAVSALPSPNFQLQPSPFMQGETEEQRRKRELIAQLTIPNFQLNQPFGG